MEKKREEKIKFFTGSLKFTKLYYTTTHNYDDDDDDERNANNFLELGRSLGL